MDPSRFKFKKVVRIVSIVFGFIRKLKEKVAARKLKEISGVGDFVGVEVIEKRSSVKSFFSTFDEGSLKDHFIVKVDKTDELVYTSTEIVPVGKKFGLVFLTSTEIIKLREQVSKEVKKTKGKKVAVIYDEDIDKALHYLYKKATEEVEQFVPAKMWKDTVKVDGVRFWVTRVLPTQEFSVGKQLQDVMLDLSPTVFCVPVVDQYSPLAWSIVMDVHWDHPTAKHTGVPTVVRYCSGLAHIFNCSQVAQVVKSCCARCRFIRKKTLQVEVGPLSTPQLKIAPAYYVTQCDLFGPLKSFSMTNARQTTKIWGCVFVCLATSCCSIQVMEDYSAASFVQGYNRFSCNNGHVRLLLVDEGKNVESGGREMDIDWVDVKYQLHVNKRVTVETCPVGDHHQHGKVERKIQQIKLTLMRSLSGERLTSLGWQTVFDSAANAVNNLPIAREASSMSGVKQDVDNMDLVTPNRLKFGRNNDMAPLAPAVITNDPKKITEATWRAFESWWRNWLDFALPKLLDRPQGSKGDRDLEIDDIVLMKKQEGDMAGYYRFGIVDKLMNSADEVTRKVQLRYRNVGEQVDRFTTRGVSGLVLIRRCDELDIWTAMFEASKLSDLMYTKDYE